MGRGKEGGESGGGRGDGGGREYRESIRNHGPAARPNISAFACNFRAVPREQKRGMNLRFD